MHEEEVGLRTFNPTCDVNLLLNRKLRSHYARTLSDRIHDVLLRARDLDQWLRRRVSKHAARSRKS